MDEVMVLLSGAISEIASLRAMMCAMSVMVIAMSLIFAAWIIAMDRRCRNCAPKADGSPDTPGAKEGQGCGSARPDDNPRATGASR